MTEEKNDYYNSPLNRLAMESDAKKAKLGSGARFKALKTKLARQGVSDPGALAAAIGRKKYGKVKFQKLAAAGRKKKK